MSFDDFQNQTNSARATSEGKRADYMVARRKASNIQREREALLRQIGSEGRENNESLAELEKAQTELTRQANAAGRDYRATLANEAAALGALAEFTDPIKNIGFLQDDCPILLFPLRLETRFKKIIRDDVILDQLWVRVFPDDIAINSFERDLSDTEVRNARSYWQARWAAGKNVDGNRGAWRSLAAAHGPGRAYWLTQNYVPVNLSEEHEKGEGELILAIGTDVELVEPELSALSAYWQEVWRAENDNARLDQAWIDLVAVVGEARAKTLLGDYAPANLNEPPPPGFTRDDTSVLVKHVIFEATDTLEAKLHAWSQPPTTSILPERFVFLAFQEGEEPMTPQLGNLVPPNLILGPDPAAEQGEDLRLATQEDVETDPSLREGDLIFSENMLWMFDFDEAVAKGMGFKIDLTAEQAENGFDRVFVLGVKLSADREKGGTLLEELFEQHQYSRKGLAILKQGTPTNNTEDEGAGYSWRHDPDDSFKIYFGESTEPDPLDWFEKRDGRWLADLLGINPEKLQSVENYYSTDIAEARAMQRALWPATLGHFMDSMMNPVFGPNTIEQTRLFFTRYVNGRGTLPAIRVGKQPYGILPATDYTHMGWFRRKGIEDHAFTSAPLLAGGGNFLAGLYQILLDMDQVWMDLHRLAGYVGKTGNPQQILLDIVGLHPASVEVYKRYANSLKQIHNIYGIQALDHSPFFSYYPTTLVTAESLLAQYGYTIDAEHPEPEILKKSFFKNAWVLNGDRIDKVPNSEVEPIAAYTEDGKNYIGWLIEAAQDSHDRLRLQADFIDDKPPTALLYLLLYHALDLSFIDTGLKLHFNRGVLDQLQVQQAYIEPDFIHIEAEKETESRWKYLYTSDQRLTGDTGLMLGEYIPRFIDSLDEAAAFRDALAGLQSLENVPTAALERLMMEHIDTVSYRLDAWILGYLQLQLENMRGLQADEPANPERGGIYIGAYGWLEELRPEGKDLTPVQLTEDLNEVFNPDGDLVEDNTNAGYILAPSQNHAVTAAVLRNGHLSNEDPEDKEELKIKLTSERVRMALQIIEGIQGGQTLAALLGYRFERGLHDRTDAEVDAFIFDLRNKFPLASKKFKDTAPGPEDPEYESIDQIEARNVIDGVAFLEHIQETKISTYPFGLSLPSATPDQETAINQEVLELIDLNDAVADLALAESVHQVVMGNYERASATLDTYSKGNFPPTPDVIQTPRSGITLTHRVALQFKTGLSNTLGDAGVTPRMVSEPAIQDWLNQIMPGLDEIVCVVVTVDTGTGSEEEDEVSLADLGLGHLDLLYMLNVESQQAMTALDDRIVQHVWSDDIDFSPQLDKPIQIDYTRKLDPTKVTIFEVSSLVASLRALLLRSKALTAGDVKLANEAAKQDEQSVSLDPNRVQPLVAALNGLRTIDIADAITDLTDHIATSDVDGMFAQLDTWIDRIAALFVQTAAFGIVQTSTGFIYQWRQSMFSRLRLKLGEVIERWEARRADYIFLRADYLVKLGSETDEVLFDIVRRAELKISSESTMHLYTDSASYFAAVDGTQFGQFEDILNNTIKPILDLQSLPALVPDIQALAGQLAPFDVVGIDISDQLGQVSVFMNDLLQALQNVSEEMLERETRAGELLGGVGAEANAGARVELVSNAAKAIFGDDFITLPEFILDAEQGTEWENTLIDSEHSLRYLLTDLDMDFPVDDWLYGISRVREKLHHLENTILHIEGFSNQTLSLAPSQFPYREDDYWLGLQFPQTKDGSDEAFTISEDKLLFTAIYSQPFAPGQAQCGVLLDEWTEVIPSLDETLGLTFHYDQPNTEPPQSLLLVTPSSFTGNWQWQELVNTLHATLDMAKKRAVEPDHVDLTAYSRFLPPIVSLTSPMPLTATLNLALNNQVAYLKVNDHD